jgi:hypothetical protein
MSTYKLPDYINDSYKPDDKMLTKGNSKLGNIWNFSLPAVESCPNCEDCKLTCYATKGHYRQKNVREKYKNNFKIVHQNSEYFEQSIQAQIDKRNIKVVRIHTSGDFFSLQYFQNWLNIVYANRDTVQFFTYTKEQPILDYWCEIKNNSTLWYKWGWRNLNIIPSFTKSGKLNYGSLEYVKNIRKKEGGIICPANLGVDITCEQCKICYTKENLLFVEH